MKTRVLQEHKEDLTQFSANQPFMEQISRKNEITYWLPCYVRLQIKQINSIDLSATSGSFEGTLKISFYYGGLDREILQQFIGNEGQKAILIQLSGQDSILLTKGQKGIDITDDFKNYLVEYKILQQFQTSMIPHIFLTPFEIIQLKLTMTMQNIHLDPTKNKGKHITIKFNCMDTIDSMRINYSKKIATQSYRLATSYLQIKCTNKSVYPFQHISKQTGPCCYNCSLGCLKACRGFWSTICFCSYCTCDCFLSWGFEHELDKEEEDKDKIKKIIDKTNKENIKRGQISSAQIIEIESKSLSPTKKANYQLPLVKNSPLKKQNFKDAITTVEPVEFKNYQYIHFRIPMYQVPGAKMAAIFVPLFIINLINLLVFFQGNDLSSRLSIISTLTLAFIALIPTINDKLPQTQYITGIQYVIYGYTAATVMCLFHSVYIWLTQDQLAYVFIWNEQPVFLITMGVNVVCFLIVIITMTLHKCVWEPDYIKPKLKLSQNLIRNQWEQKQLNQELYKYFQSERLKVI